jgi:hypothetical protein
LNHKPRTLHSSFTSVRLFLEFYAKSGKRELAEMERAIKGGRKTRRSEGG